MGAFLKKTKLDLARVSRQVEEMAQQRDEFDATVSVLDRAWKQLEAGLAEIAARHGVKIEPMMHMDIDPSTAPSGSAGGKNFGASRPGVHVGGCHACAR